MCASARLVLNRFARTCMIRGERAISLRGPQISSDTSSPGGAHIASDINLWGEGHIALTPAPVRAPLTSIPVGQPWQLVAVDVLEVPVLYSTNQYLLVIQDYFTKWAEAIPMWDQTAMWITVELMKVFSVLGVPDVLHSDQGQNFENTILKETLEAFGVEKSHTTAYHPQGDSNGKAIASRFSHSRRQVLHLISIKHDIKFLCQSFFFVVMLSFSGFQITLCKGLYEFQIC